MPDVLAYARRIVDDELDELLRELAAIAIEGPKGVGKTRTALERARTVHRLDDPAELAVAEADPARLLAGERPVLIDEWQRLPQIWDLVRRAVDDGAGPGSFLLTGSAVPASPPTHSGAGRIVTVRMRPLTLDERLDSATVGLGSLLTGASSEISGTTATTLSGYVEEILASGLPAVRRLTGRARRSQLDGYLDRIVDRDIPDDAGVVVRNPAALRRWMTAYAASVSTTASLETIRDAATAGNDQKPSRTATQAYRDALTRVWILDVVPAWVASNNRLSELGQAPKHQLADPALAARLLEERLDLRVIGGARHVRDHLERGGLLVGRLRDGLGQHLGGRRRVGGRAATAPAGGGFIGAARGHRQRARDHEHQRDWLLHHTRPWHTGCSSVPPPRVKRTTPGSIARNLQGGRPIVGPPART